MLHYLATMTSMEGFKLHDNSAILEQDREI